MWRCVKKWVQGKSAGHRTLGQVAHLFSDVPVDLSASSGGSPPSNSSAGKPRGEASRAGGPG